MTNITGLIIIGIGYFAYAVLHSESLKAKIANSFEKIKKDIKKHYDDTVNKL